MIKKLNVRIIYIIMVCIAEEYRKNDGRNYYKMKEQDESDYLITDGVLQL